jgi:hypothetical protein
MIVIFKMLKIPPASVTLSKRQVSFFLESKNLNSAVCILFLLQAFKELSSDSSFLTDVEGGMPLVGLLFESK